MTIAEYIELCLRRQWDKHGLWESDDPDDRAKEIEDKINSLTNLELLEYIELYREEHPWQTT